MSSSSKRPVSPSEPSEVEKRQKNQCEKCGLEYSSKTYHERSKCATKIRCKYSSGDVMLERQDGTFTCAYCSKSLVKPSVMQAHAKLCPGVPSTNAGSSIVTKKPLLGSPPLFEDGPDLSASNSTGVPTLASKESSADVVPDKIRKAPQDSDDHSKATPSLDRTRTQCSPAGDPGDFPNTVAINDNPGGKSPAATTIDDPADVFSKDDFSSKGKQSDRPPSFPGTDPVSRPDQDARIQPGNHDRLDGILLGTPYVVNTLHSALICLECKCAVLPSSASTHIRSQHAQCRVPRDFSSDLEREYPGLRSSFVHPSEAIPPVFGLAVSEEKYVVCPICFHGYRNQASLRSHICGSFEDTNLETEKDKDEPFWSYVQTFFIGNKRAYFPINLPKQPAPTGESQSSYNIYLSNQKSTTPHNSLERSFPEDFRQLQRFLRQEGWLDHVRSFPVNELADLIALPDQDHELHPLSDAVFSVVQALQEEIHMAGQFVQRLVGRRPTHGGVRYIRHGALEAPTVKRYAVTISQLIFFVLRCHQGWTCGYKMELGDATTDNSRQLLAHLQSLPAQLEPSDTVEDASSDDDEEEEEDEEHEEEGEGERGSDNALAGEMAVHELGLPKRQLSAAQQLVLDIIKSLYMQLPTGASDKFYSPVLRFIILSCYGKGGDWLTSREITRFFSIFTFCGRLAIYDNMRDVVAENPGMRFSDAARVLNKYLDEEFEGPLACLYLLRRPLDRFAQTEGAPFTFTAADFSGQNVIVCGKTLYIAEVKHMVETLVSELKTCLKDQLLFGISDLMDVDSWTPGTIHEEPRNTRSGYSCLSDPHNSTWTQEDWLLKIFLDHPAVAGRFHLICDDQVVWRAAPCLQYLQKCHEFEMLLFVAAHLTVGEPPRGTEFASHSIRNIPGGSIRNVFVLFQHLCLMGTFNKSAFTKSCIIRVPLPEIGRLWLLYLSHIRPVVYTWQRYFDGAPAAARATNNLFFGFRGPVKSTDLSVALERHTSRLLGISINLSLWRHIVTWFLNHHAVKFHEFLSLSNRAVLAAQMGHSEATHGLYAADARLPAGIDFHVCFQSMKTSGIWHDLLGFPPVLVNRIQESANSITSFSHKHGAAPAPTNNGSTSDVSSVFKSAILPELSRMQSRDRAADFASLLHFMKTEGGQVASGICKDLIGTMSVHPHRLIALRRLLRDESAFFKTPQQAEAVEAIASQEPSLLIIGPTSSGKTLPVMLNIAEYDQGRTTVFVLPLLAMHPEYISRANRCKISVEIWKWNSSPGHAPQMVLVAAESCPWDSFKIYLASLLSTGRLARLVIDEVHLLLKHKGFRPCLSMLQHFGCLAIPIVLMTATCPPDMESALFQSIGRQAYTVLRQATDRPEISQHFIPLYNIRDETTFEQEVSRRITDLAGRLQPQERMLLFCLSHGQCDRLATLLNWHPYHSHVTPEDRSKSMDAWQRGSIVGLAATSMLNCCLDYPHVRYVFHLGLPRDAMDYYQAIGRCARDEAKGISHVYYDPNDMGSAAPRQDPFGRGVIMQMARKDTVCRRVRPGKFLDGFSAPCILLKKGVFCDNCESAASSAPNISDTTGTGIPTAPLIDNTASSTQTPFPVILSAAYAATYAAERPTGEGIGDVIMRACEVLDKCCTYCWIAGSSSGTNHTLDQCTKSENIRLSKDYGQDWIDKLTLPRGYCFYCGCSQRINYQTASKQDLRVHSHEARRTCHWQHIFKPISYFVHTMLKEEVKTLIPEVEMDRKDFISWLSTNDASGDVVQLNRLLVKLCLYMPLPFIGE